MMHELFAVELAREHHTRLLRAAAAAAMARAAEGRGHVRAGPGRRPRIR